VVTETLGIVQCYFVVFRGYFGYSNSRYSAMLLCFFVVYFGYSISRYSAIVGCCVGVYCGYRKSRYSAKVLCCVCGVYCG